MSVTDTSLDTLCVNTVRTLSIDAVQQANSGHPGMPMGAAPMAYVLWQRHMRHNPANPKWADRDRFVLSGGHGSMLLYSLLHLTGYGVSLEDLKAFRQWGSKTPGHPEFGMTPGVEATTGPLGQGAANVVGMAMAERALAQRFNRPGHEIVDHYTYGLVTDGDLMEGISAEAASLAGYLGLGKLICLYDANDICLDGPTNMTLRDDEIEARYAAYGWQVLRVADGDRDLENIDHALTEAKADGARPTLIVVKTTIGFGSPAKQGKSDAHGAPLGDEEVARAKSAYGFDPQKTFEIPADALARFREAQTRGAEWESDWNERFSAYEAAHGELAAEWKRRFAGELPADFDADLPKWAEGEKLATRDAGGKALNALAGRVPELFGGDADLSCSTKTAIRDGGSFAAAEGGGRNVHFGVREHAMAAVGNGLLYHGGFRPYVSTFFVFSDYMRPPVRLAALGHLPLISVWTHDSVAVGEDGPTHQPVEHLASLRAMPNLDVLRPADANETAQAWRVALTSRERPVALVFSRQKLPVLPGTADLAAEGVRRGGYVLADASGRIGLDVILIATGSEVWIAMEAQRTLEAEGVGVRVVSMPSWERFAEQDDAYRESVLPARTRRRVSIEAGATFGWERWVGDGGVTLGIDRFGASAPGDTNLEKYGMSAERIVAAARSLLG